MSVSRDDFLRFFEAKKNGTYKCPFCSKEAFGINLVSQEHQESTAQLAIASTLDGFTPVATHVFYAFSCLNCGHTDFFHKIQVEQWVEENKIEPADG